MEQVLQMALRFLKEGRAGVMATVLESEGSTPAKAGAKMMIADDGTITGTVGGGSLEQLVIRDAVKLIETEASSVLEKDYSLDPEQGNTGMWCGGRCRIMLECLIPPCRVHILGAGHIAMPLANILNMAGFRVCVADDRENLLTCDRFPHADLVHIASYQEYVRCQEVKERDCIVIVTRSHALDQESVAASLETGAGYIGMIGSSGKITKIRTALEKMGFSSERIDQVHAPVGLAIGAVSPAEIAVSIAAEVIAWRRGFTLAGK